MEKKVTVSKKYDTIHDIIIYTLSVSTENNLSTILNMRVHMFERNDDKTFLELGRTIENLLKNEYE